MVERLKFGTPKTFNQALIRLTDFSDPRRMQNHPDFDPVYLYLGNLRFMIESVINKRFTPKDKLPLEMRSTHLNLDAVKLMERRGFKRGKEIINAPWTAIDYSDTKWSSFFWFTKEDPGESYRNWRVSEILPKRKSGLQLICIEINPNFNYADVNNWPTNENSDFNFILLTDQETSSLVENLDRYRIDRFAFPKEPQKNLL